MTDAAKRALEPCPFCGGNELNLSRGGVDDEVTFIQCKCEAGGPSSFPRDDETAADKWNTRAPVEAVPQEVVDALECCHEAMNDYLNGKHFDLKAMRTATYFSNPIDKAEKALTILNSAAKPPSKDTDAYARQFIKLLGMEGEFICWLAGDGMPAKPPMPEEVKEAITTLRHQLRNNMFWSHHAAPIETLIREIESKYGA